MKKAHQILEQKGVRITAMRQLLLVHFLQNDGTFGLMELESAFPKSDRITMYRTLKRFEQKGIIHGINNGNGELKYALCDQHCTPSLHIDQHPHFKCEECKQITCIDSLVIPKMDLPKGYLQKEMNMIISGICPACQS